MEIYRPKSKAEIYKEKLKERELYSNNFLDRFTENGAGAPLRNKEGNVITKRKTLLNNNYEDYYLNQGNQGNRSTTPLSYNYNQQINSLQEINNNNNFYQTLPLGVIDNNVYNIKNVNERENNNNNFNNNNNIINNEYDFRKQTFEKRPRSQINYNNKELRDYDHYEGTGVILKENGLEENNRKRYQNLREEWLKEIEEKKEREALRKQKEREEEYKLEEKYKKEMEEQREKEKFEKIKLNDNYRDMTNINLAMIENNKKKKNLLELDLNNNFNNNYNPQQETAMNGNNIEQISPQYNNEIIAENESNYQNFGIIRTPDNNINNNTNEIMK